MTFSQNTVNTRIIIIIIFVSLAAFPSQLAIVEMLQLKLATAFYIRWWCTQHPAIVFTSSNYSHKTCSRNSVFAMKYVTSLTRLHHDEAVMRENVIFPDGTRILGVSYIVSLWFLFWYCCEVHLIRVYVHICVGERI